jgi:hypothetical protein
MNDVKFAFRQLLKRGCATGLVLTIVGLGIPMTPAVEAECSFVRRPRRRSL